MTQYSQTLGLGRPLYCYLPSQIGSFSSPRGGECRHGFSQLWESQLKLRPVRFFWSRFIGGIQMVLMQICTNRRRNDCWMYVLIRHLDRIHETIGLQPWHVALWPGGSGFEREESDPYKAREVSTCQWTFPLLQSLLPSASARVPECQSSYRRAYQPA